MSLCKPRKPKVTIPVQGTLHQTPAAGCDQFINSCLVQRMQNPRWELERAAEGWGDLQELLLGLHRPGGAPRTPHTPRGAAPSWVSLWDLSLRGDAAPKIIIKPVLCPLSELEEEVHEALTLLFDILSNPALHPQCFLRNPNCPSFILCIF